MTSGPGTGVSSTSSSMGGRRFTSADEIVGADLAGAAPPELPRLAEHGPDRWPPPSFRLAGGSAQQPRVRPVDLGRAPAVDAGVRRRADRPCRPPRRAAALGRCRPPPPRDGGPEILVSVSTSPHVRLGASLETFLGEVTTALAALPHPALVTASFSPRGELPPHVQVVPFAEHGPLMGSVRLFIHHGGWGSIGRCLLSGVPMIVAPFERDQPANGLACERLGIGVKVDPARTSAAALGRLIESLVDRGAPQARLVAAHAARLATAPPPARALDLLLARLLRPA